MNAESTASLKREREFHYTDKDFKYITKLVLDSTGIVLADTKREMVYSRLTRRIRELRLKDFASYCEILRSGDENELVNFTNSITTNLTSFFREAHHFEYLTNVALPKVMQATRSRTLRVWSAGCSSGEEPYCLAMVIRESLPIDSGWEVKILATDIDSNMVTHARNGIYDIERVQGLPMNRLRRWFVRGKGAKAGKVKVRSELQDMIQFRQLNLIGDWPFREKMDIIFCRNVVIYFNAATQKILFNRYADLLADHGTLFIGHSESLHSVSDRFKLLGKSIYEKVS